MFPVHWLQACFLLAVCATCGSALNTRDATQTQETSGGDDNGRSSWLARERRDIKRKIGLFRLAGQLYSEQKEDQNMAFQKISMMLGDTIATEIQPQNNQTSVTEGTVVSSSGDNTPGNEDTGSTTESEDLPSSTPAPPYKVTRNQLFAILRKNLRGLQNLLQAEWRTAIEDSNKNSAAATLEFRNSVKPFITKNTTRLENKA